MKDSLRSKGLLPLNTPYIDTLKYAFGNDGKSVLQSSLNEFGPNSIVDWVYLEIYEEFSSTIVDGGSYLLQRDGDVIDIDGSIPVFENLADGQYRLRVYHRNHLPIMTSESITIDMNTIESIDFTLDIDAVLGGVNAIKIIGGKYTMIAGDVNQNGQIQQTDLNQILPKIGQAGYLIEDIDLNGEIQNTDMQLIVLPNLGRGKQF